METANKDEAVPRWLSVAGSVASILSLPVALLLAIWHDNWAYAVVFGLILVTFPFSLPTFLAVLSRGRGYIWILSVFQKTSVKWFMSDPNRKSTILKLLDVARAFMPSARCSEHDLKIKEAFESIGIMVKENFECAWLLPPFSRKMMLDPAHKHLDDYLNLELREWSGVVTGEGTPEQKERSDTALVNRARYLFITWDLTDLPYWCDMGKRGPLANLTPMLERLSKRSEGPEPKLFIDRIVVVKSVCDVISNRDDFVRICQKIGAAPSSHPHYKIRFICMAHLLAAAEAVRVPPDEFLDVAFFSFAGSAIGTFLGEAPRPVLPSPAEAGTTIFGTEYAAVQFSRRLEYNKRLLMLYLALGTTANGGGKQAMHGRRRGDQLIRAKRERVRKILDRLPKEEEERLRQESHHTFHELLRETVGQDWPEFSELPWPTEESDATP